MTRALVIIAAALAWATCFFFIARVAIPGLVNMQNDGALIAALLLAFLTVVGTAFLLMQFFKEIGN